MGGKHPWQLFLDNQQPTSQNSKTNLFLAILVEFAEVKIDAEDVLSFLQRGVGMLDFVFLLGGDGLTFFINDKVVRVGLLVGIASWFCYRKRGTARAMSQNR